MKKLLLGLLLAPTLTFAAEPPPVLATGSPAPAFDLPGIDGKNHTLEEYSGSKALLIVFTCAHCPDAYAARHRIQEVYKDYKDKGLTLIAISGNNPGSLSPNELGYSPYGDSFEEMKPFAEESGWTFPYLYDGETQTVTSAYGAQATPHVFLFDADRKLVYNGRMDDARRNDGPVEKSYVRDAIDSVLADETPEPQTTRPFGCSTKWLYKADAVAKRQAEWEGLPVTLSDLDAELAKKLRANDTEKVRVINFWSTSCPPCLAEFPDLVTTNRRFQNRPFELITISLDPDSSAAKAKKFLEKNHAALSKRTAPSLKEEGRESNNYRFTGSNPDDLAEAIDKDWTGAQPHTLILLPGGEIHWTHTGALEFFEFHKQILSAINKVTEKE